VRSEQPCPCDVAPCVVTLSLMHTAVHANGLSRSCLTEQAVRMCCSSRSLHGATCSPSSTLLDEQEARGANTFEAAQKCRPHTSALSFLFSKHFLVG
jgi:hypothetical protein